MIMLLTYLGKVDRLNEVFISLSNGMIILTGSNLNNGTNINYKCE